MVLWLPPGLPLSAVPKEDSTIAGDVVVEVVAFPLDTTLVLPGVARASPWSDVPLRSAAAAAVEVRLELCLFIYFLENVGRVSDLSFRFDA